MNTSLNTLLQIPSPTAAAGALAAGVVGLLLGYIFSRIAARLPIMMEREVKNFIAEESGLNLPHPEKFNLLQPLITPRDLRTNPAITCISSAILFAFTVWMFGFELKTAASLFLVGTLIILTVIDAKTKLLPDDLTLPLVWSGLLVNSVGVFASLESALYGAVFGYIGLWTMYWAFKIATGKEGMGYGDFKLLAALGAWFGVGAIPMILILAAGVGSIVGIAIMVITKQGKDYQMPFGPYLAGAGLMILFFEPWITLFLGRLLGA